MLASSRTRLRRVSALFASFVLALATLAIAVPPEAAANLVTRTEAERVGLTRVWHTQARVDRGRSEVTTAVLDGGALYVLTSSTTLQAFDAETGAELWDVHLGGPRPSGVLGPALNSTAIALIADDRLHVVDRATGIPKSSRRLKGGLLTPPALGETRVYTSLLDGRMIAYDITPEGKLPAITATGGEAFLPPVATPWGVLWVTDEGNIYKARAAGGVAYRLSAGGPLAREPLVNGELAFAVTRTGHVMRFQTETGTIRWRSSLGAEASGVISLVGETLFAGTTAGTLRAIDANTGKVAWTVEGLVEVLAVSADRVYGLTAAGDLGLVDRETGEPLDAIRLDGSTHGVVNTLNDRIYLVDASGLIQCLHEVGRDTPLAVVGVGEVDTETGEEATADATPAPAAEAVAATADDDGDAFEGGAFEGGLDGDLGGGGFADPSFDDSGFGGDDGFGDEADSPTADEPAADDDPFGDPFADF